MNLPRGSEATENLIEDFAMLIRRMAHRLHRHSESTGDKLLARQADAFLKRHGLHGSSETQRTHYDPVAEAEARAKEQVTDKEGRQFIKDGYGNWVKAPSVSIAVVSNHSPVSNQSPKK